MNGHEQRIREVAFYLWEQEGYPDGQAERHWRMAKEMIEKEDADRREQEGEPPGERADMEQARDTTSKGRVQ
jgi:hypothetical protein